jgi:hypothetical protein
MPQPCSVDMLNFTADLPISSVFRFSNTFGNSRAFKW